MNLTDQIAADIQGWDAIGEHRTGTDGDRRTSAWLAKQAADAGVSCKQPEFELQRWVPRRCDVRIGEKVVEGVPLFDGGTTGAEGVRAPLRDLANDASSRPSAENTIGLAKFGTAAGPESNQALALARRANDHPALVAVSKMNAAVPGLALQNADSFTEPFGPPVLQVATEHEPWLQAASANESEAHVTVDVGKEIASASNVEVHIQGHRSELAPLFVITPKSSWWVSTAERGGGIAVWLALLRHFASHRPARDVRLIATSGHELGHLGLKAQLQALASRPVHTWIHLGANFACVDSEVRLQTSAAHLRHSALAAMSEEGITPATETPPGTRPGGEARDIFDRGDAYISYLGSNAWFHHPADRWPDTIDLQTATRLTKAMITIANGLAAK